MLGGLTLVFAVGIPWLAIFVGGLHNALVAGFYPFIPGALIKCALAALLLPSAWRLVNGRRTDRD